MVEASLLQIRVRHDEEGESRCFGEKRETEGISKGSLYRLET